MPIYPYSFQLPPLNVQDIPNDGAVGEFLGISAGGVLDWLPVATGGGDMLKSENLSGLADYAIARTNIGLGTASTPTFANLTLTSPSLASSAPVTISQTWAGTSGTFFSALKVNVTTSGSSTTSLLLDLQVGGASYVTVSRVGNLTVSGSVTAGNGTMSIASTGLSLANNSVVQWASSGSSGGSKDTILLRDGAANTLALRNGGAAQTFNVYGTWTTAITNFERLAIKYNTTDVAYQIAAEKGTTNGDYRPLQLWTGGASRLHVTTAGNVGIGTTSPTSKLDVYLNPSASYTTETVKFGNIHFGNGTGDYSNIWIGSIATPLTLSASNYTLANNGTNTIINGGSGGLFFHVGAQAHWNIQSTGHLLCSSDNSRDIGASGALRPRTVYVADTLYVGTTNLIALGSVDGGILNWNGRANIMSPGSSIIRLLDNPRTNFDRLQFGGGTDAFPAIARDGAGIKFTGAAAGLTSHIKVPPVAVSSLPLANTAGAGARAFVNDALAPTFGSAVTGGGAVLVPVYSTGSAWNVG